MHDSELEHRLREALRGEGEAPPLTITTSELERRLALRRRERLGRRASVLAAGVAVIAVVSLAATTGGWFRSTSVGSEASLAPTPSPAPSEASLPCESIDPSTMDEPPNLLMGASPGDAKAYGGLGSSYRLGDRQVGQEGTWDHDTIGFEAVTAGFPTERIQVLASDPDACLVGLQVDARPSDLMGDEPVRLAELTSEPRRVLEFAKPPVGDWFVLVHAEFAAPSGAVAWRETFFAIEVPDCAPLDPSTTVAPPVIGLVSAFEGSGASHDGAQVASAWNGQVVGTPGTWDGLPAEPDQVATAPGFDGLQAIASACLIDVQAEALLTEYAQVPDPAPVPIELQVRRGEGSPAVDVVPPPTGGWTVRIRASFPTVDGSEAWSETLFRVASRFLAPGLTIGPDFFEIMGGAGCASYQLESGASAADQCGAQYELYEGREPVPVASGAPLELRLEDAWVIDEARTIAVDADLVARGEFAPEYSVDFQDNVGKTLTVPITLDPGSWILRITLNGNRQGDTFGAHYDIAVTVTPQ
jgi:hypothetical protein